MEYFNFHTHKSTLQNNVLELVNQYPQEFDAAIPFYSVGIHPWYITQDRIEEDLKTIDKVLEFENCLAAGECGIDKRVETPLDIQIEVFEAQLLLAQKHQKPVVIHCVASFQEVIEIKNRLKITVPMIFHGFSKNQQLAQDLIRHGFYLSFGKYLMLNPDLESVFKNIPNERFFLETDTLELEIQQVYLKAATIKGIEVKELIEIVNRNFETVFHKQK